MKPDYSNKKKENSFAVIDPSMPWTEPSTEFSTNNYQVSQTHFTRTQLHILFYTSFCTQKMEPFLAFEISVLRSCLPQPFEHNPLVSFQPPLSSYSQLFKHLNCFNSDFPLLRTHHPWQQNLHKMRQRQKSSARNSKIQFFTYFFPPSRKKIY